MNQNTAKNKNGILSMCRKAGRLVMGMDMVKDSLENGEAKAVFVCNDISEKSLKEVKFFCNKYGKKLFALDYTMDQAGQCIGKKVGVISVTDGGFAKSISKGLEQISCE